jgi:hypothetical protein
VKDRFIDNPAGRLFIPARLRDNPHVDAPEYERALGELDQQTRAQLLDGDWNARQPGDWVYDQAGIDAAEELGRVFDEQYADGTLAPPADGELVLGIDWGIGCTHALVVWPLAGGGLYVPPGEVVAERGEPSYLTHLMLDAADQYPHPLAEARYDSAGAQQMATFTAHAPRSVGIYAVHFNKRKQQTIGYLRKLFRRAADGKRTQIIAISPRNQVLLAQLRGLEFDNQDEGRVRKGDDHGPDALLAAASPVAARYPAQVPA